MVQAYIDAIDWTCNCAGQGAAMTTNLAALAQILADWSDRVPQTTVLNRSSQPSDVAWLEEIFSQHGSTTFEEKVRLLWLLGEEALGGEFALINGQVLLTQSGYGPGKTQRIPLYVASVASIPSSASGGTVEFLTDTITLSLKRPAYILWQLALYAWFDSLGVDAYGVSLVHDSVFSSSVIAAGRYIPHLTIDAATMTPTTWFAPGTLAHPASLEVSDGLHTFTLNLVKSRTTLQSNLARFEAHPTIYVTNATANPASLASYLEIIYK